jgi:hypothetical protein
MCVGKEVQEGDFVLEGTEGMNGRQAGRNEARGTRLER